MKYKAYRKKEVWSGVCDSGNDWWAFLQRFHKHRRHNCIENKHQTEAENSQTNGNLQTMTFLNFLIAWNKSIPIYNLKLSVCMFVCEQICLLPINSAPWRSTQHRIHILNHHNPASVLVHNLLPLTVCWEFLFDVSFKRKNRKLLQFTFSQPYYKSRQKVVRLILDADTCFELAAFKDSPLRGWHLQLVILSRADTIIET